jgi:hypothetical protein
LDEVVSVAELIGVSLLKIDVQGFEGAVLRGAGELLEHLQYVYCELSFRELYAGQCLADEVIEWLRSAGFGLSAINNLTYDKSSLPVQADFLFERLAVTTCA